ncbi:MAG: class I SAM-dependent methyltransferase [Betaproteobacteria bacterium]|nr:class I SAM-dependent methyltransferase [Betaproteobacteria bacterium]
MTPEGYEAWYGTPRGRWIGATELRLLQRLAGLLPHETLLDVGCGTGWFTRRFALRNGWLVTGLDQDPSRLAYARAHGRNERYLEGNARALPFADAAFDRVVSMTALCFVDDWRQALAEMARVARRRVVVGVLNRRSLLWRGKGRAGGAGGYAGAYWHEWDELTLALEALGLVNLRLRSAVFLPGWGWRQGWLTRTAEHLLTERLPWGGVIVAAADKPS